jgi:hypothetical protein
MVRHLPPASLKSLRPNPNTPLASTMTTANAMTSASAVADAHLP